MTNVKKWGVTWEKETGKSGLDWAVEQETADFLYGFTRLIKPVRVLEIGTFEALSSTAIGKALKRNNLGKLYTIDKKDYGQRKIIKDEKLEDWVECIIDNAEEARKLIQYGLFDMIFIDDGHSYEDITRDLLVSESLVRRFGYILGHDIFTVSDVEKGVYDFRTTRPNEYEYTVISSYTGLFILRKM